MRINFKNEWWFIFMLLLPIAYLSFVWKQMPDIVPTHFDFSGKANGWSSKGSLGLIVTLIPLDIYLLMLFLPRIDPKRKIAQMGERYNILRLIVSLFITLINLLMVYTACNGGVKNLGNLVFILIGALFLFLGNYMPVTKPNYFIGLRTPWTLNNDYVWQRTHRIAGRMMFAAGILLIIAGIFVPDKYEWKSDIILWVSLSSVLIPAAYSYFIWRKNSDKIDDSK